MSLKPLPHVPPKFSTMAYLRMIKPRILMVGKSLSHHKFLEELGRGGTGMDTPVPKMTIENTQSRTHLPPLLLGSYHRGCYTHSISGSFAY